MPDSTYNEVLAVTVNTTEFADGLKQLAELYEAWLEQIGAESASGINNTAVLSSLVSGINEIKAAISGLNADFVQSFDNMAVKAGESLDTVAAKAAETKAQVETALQDTKNAEQSPEGGAGNISASQRRRGQDIVTDVEGTQNKSDEDLLAQSRKSYEERQKLQAQFEKGELDTILATQGAQDKADEELLAKARQSYEQKQKLQQQFINGERDAEAAAQGERDRLDKAFNTEREDGIIAEQRIRQDAEDKATKSHEKSMKDSQQVEIDGRNSQFRAFQEFQDKETASANKAAQERAAYEKRFEEDRLDALAAHQAAVQRAAEQEESGVNRVRAAQEKRANRGIFDNLGEDVAELAKALVIWQALNAIFEGIATVVSAPFKAFGEGLTYLKETQAAADDLLGVLIANVKFSNDLTENFSKAKDGAEAVTKALQSTAAETGLKGDDLNRIFKAFTEAGGARVAGSLGDMVKLTEEFGLALRASGASAQSIRSIVSDIPKLLNGTVQPTSKFLEVLHMTSAEWAVMRNEALKTGDLLSLLEPHLRPYLTAVEKMKVDQAAVVTQLELMAHQIEGLVANETFEMLTGFFRDLIQLVNDNKAAIEAYAELLGHTLAETIQSVSQLFSLITKPDEGQHGFIAQMAYRCQLAVISIKELIDQFRILGKFNPFDIEDVVLGGLGGNQNAADAARGRMDQIVQDSDRAHDIAVNERKKAEEIYNGNIPKGGPDKGTLDGKITDKGPHPSLDKGVSTLGEDKAEFTREADEIKAVYDSLRESVAESVSAGTTSHKEALDKIKDYAREEVLAIEVVAQAYKDKIKASGAKPEQQGKANEQTDDYLVKLQDSIGKQVSASKRAANSEDLTIREEGLKAELALEKQSADETIAITRQSVAMGYETELNAMALEEALHLQGYASKKALQDKELALLSTTGEKHAQILNQQKSDEQAYNAFVDKSALDRVALYERETQATREFALRSAEAHQQAASVAAETDAERYGGDASRKVFDIQRETIALQRQALELELALAEAKGASTEKVRALTLQLEQNNIALLNNIKSEQQSINSTNSNPLGRALVTKAYQSQTRSDLQDNVDTARANLNGANAAANSGQIVDTKAFETALTAAETALGAYTKSISDTTPTLTVALQNFEKAFFGFDLGRALANIKTPMDAAVTGFAAFAGALQSVVGIINAVKNGIKQGGVLGGIGAGVTAAAPGLIAGVSGIASALGSALPPLVGQIVQGVGAVFSIVGNLFTAAAQHIADQINKSFNATVTAFQYQTATLAQTLTAVEAERTQAIQQLSGAKGGQAQLDKLLPTLDNEISSLQLQAQQLSQTFLSSLADLDLQAATGNSTLSQMYDTWNAINTQVYNYINAGGDAILAQKALSETLQTIQQNAQTNLNQGQATAVQDAISLNNLLIQRAQLLQNMATSEFSTANADALERQAIGSVDRGIQYQQQKAADQQQIDDLNYQITLTQDKVNAEQQVFNIATTISALHTQDAQLQITALEQQLATYKEMQQIVQSISLGPNGYQLAGGLLPPTTYNATVTVNLTVPAGTTNPATFGQAAGDAVAAEIQKMARQTIA